MANKSATNWQQVVVIEFGKRRDTTDTTDFCPRQLVTDLLRENWCNGFWSCVASCGKNARGRPTVVFFTMKLTRSAEFVFCKQ